MEAFENLSILRDNVVEFCNSREDIVGFCGKISNNLRYQPIQPQNKPVQKLVSEIRLPKLPKYKNILDSIIRENYDLKWNTTYSEN